MFNIDKFAQEHGNKLGKIAEVDGEKTEILIYSLKRLYKYLLYIVSLLLISQLMHIITTVSIIFITIFLLRIQFGGIHVGNSWLCLCVSTIIPLASGIISNNIILNLETLLVIYIFAYLVAIYIGTVDNEKRKLSKLRKQVHKKRGLLVLTLIMLINYIMISLNQQIIVNSIGLGVVISFVNLLPVKN